MGSSFSKFDTCLQSSPVINILYHFIISKAVTCDTNLNHELAFKMDFNTNIQVDAFNIMIKTIYLSSYDTFCIRNNNQCNNIKT